jgi:hypothetical protein
MLATSYEEALIGRMADDDRPRQPSVIERAKNELGREHYRSEARGTYYVWENGRWAGPLNLHEFIRAANRKLKREGRPQIAGNPAWVAT